MAVSVFELYSTSLLSFSYYFFVLPVEFVISLSLDQRRRKENRAKTDGEDRNVCVQFLSRSNCREQKSIVFFGFIPSSSNPTHPGHDVAQRLKEHHACTDPGTLEECGGCGAEGDRVLIGGSLGFLAPQRHADRERRERHLF